MNYTQEELEKVKEAGQITGKALKHGRGLLRDGALALEVVEAVEAKIVELGGKPAFPTNLSLNDIAAHYVPVLNDPLTLRKGDLVKLDVGAHLDGYMGDSAVTVVVGMPDNDLVKCVNAMLDKGISMFRPGTAIEEASAAMERVAKQFRLKAVRNLTGHSIERYMLHGGLMVPAVRMAAPKVLSEGEVFAIEPFCTAGEDMVKDSPPPTIFRWIADRPQRDMTAKRLLQAAKSDWAGLPFAKRWAQQKFGNIDLVLNRLVKDGSLYAYNQLKEVSGRPVAQAEHTVIVADKPIVTTRI